MFETLAAEFILHVAFIIRWVSLSVYARNSWMNKKQTANHTKIIQSSSSRTELSAVIHLNYVTLQLLRSAENPDNFSGGK